MKRLLKISLIIALNFLVMTDIAGQTLFEKTDGKQTDRYEDVIKWYKQLDKQNDIVHMREMGTTDAGFPLHLVMVSNDKKFDPAKWHSDKKIVIFINNGIHPGEPDGIDATMLLIKDITNKKITLPENIALGVIPVYNIGGALNRNSYSRVNQNGPEEYGFRGNSQNLDLNRDFTKNDSKESKSFAEIFHYLDPEVFIDNHVSDGADYQHTMTLITTQYEKLGKTNGAFLKNTFEPAVYEGMKVKGWDMIPYLDFETLNVTKGSVMFSDNPRYSTGYAALFNTMGFMPETHMLKPYKERVKSTYDLALTFIEQSSIMAEAIISARKSAKEEVKNQMQFPISWKTDSSETAEINFKGYEQVFSKSEATGLEKMSYDRSKPYFTKMKYYNTSKPVQNISKPKAYIIPKAYSDVIERLKINGINTRLIEEDTKMDVTVYRIDSYKSFQAPYEKHHKNHTVKISGTQKSMLITKGDYLVSTEQPGVRYIIEMLEPEGDDSFFAWNFFDGILQRKEGYSDYRWEELAAGVLKEDAELKKSWKTRKQVMQNLLQIPVKYWNSST